MLMTRTSTGAPATWARSPAIALITASREAKRVLANEFRYSFSDLDSMMFGEMQGTTSSAMATTGLPRSLSQDSS